MEKIKFESEDGIIEFFVEDNVNLLRQKVQAQRPAKQRVTLEHRQAVSDAVLHAAFLRPL